MNAFIKKLSQQKQTTVIAIYEHSNRLMSQTPRFLYFTLHNEHHFSNLFDLATILEKGGISFTETERYYLSISICIHDLGMCLGLSEKTQEDILLGYGDSNDYALIENFVRDNHHEMVDDWISNNFDFLVNLGASPTDINIVSLISKCHRKLPLLKQNGIIKKLGSILRVIDEFDITPSRAPLDTFKNMYPQMDSIARWHWFKHNIVDEWILDHNIFYSQKNGKKFISFNLVVRPPSEGSIQYWTNQISRPIKKALLDEHSKKIIEDSTNTVIQFRVDYDSSKSNKLSEYWLNIENEVLTTGRKVILVSDDESRKYEDLFFTLTQEYHIEYAYNGRDTLTKLEALKVDLAVVDIQIGSGNIWSAEETSDYKKTGIKLLEELKLNYPETKRVVLTGIKHDLPELTEDLYHLYLKKPVDPDFFHESINKLLQE